jgi:putative transposase
MKSPWLTKDEVCELTGWTERHLRRAAAAGAIESRDSTSKTYRGQPVKEYALASLPDEARAKYLESESEPNRPEEKPEWRPSEPSPLALTPLFAAAGNTAALALQTSPIRVALPPAAEKEASERIAILKPLVEYLRDRDARGKYHQLRLKNGAAVSNSAALACYLAEQHGVSTSTIWNWKRKFESAGSFALARKPRHDKNRSAWAAENRELADLAALVYMGTPEQPAQSKTVAWEHVCERAGRMGLPAPSYETVRAFLGNPEEVSPSMRLYNREGRKKYDAQCAPYMQRGYTEPANSIWVSDHMIHDVLVQNDIFGERGLEHIRLQMTTLLDYRSRYVVGVNWCENGSSHSIKRALLRAFQQHGLPEHFYCDNGKDYRKVARGARPRDMEAMATAARACVEETQSLGTSVMQRLGIPVTYCTPYHPQAKHIERYHLTVHERFDKAFISYTSGATHLRPDAATAALARHGKLLQMGRAAESALPLASDFIAMAEAWIEEWYHQQPQDGQGMHGRSPAQVFEAERNPIQRTCPEPALLAMLLCERATRKVMNCAVEISGARFVPDLADHYANLQMHERSGRRVTIAYDPLEPMYVAVLDEDLHFICRLQREDLMRFSDDTETRDQVKGFIANRNGLRKAVRESTAALSRRVRSAGFTTIEDTMRERIALPHAVGQSITQTARPPIADAGIKDTHSEDNAARYFERMKGLNHGSL